MFMVEICLSIRNVIYHSFKLDSYQSQQLILISVTKSKLWILFIQTSSWYNFQLKELWDQSNA